MTALLALDQGGTGVGYASLDFTTFFGFLRSPDGVYTQVNYPKALALGSFLLGRNESGTAVGYTADKAETQFAGFLRSREGTFRPFDIPGAQSTIPFAINNSGTIAGGFRDSAGWHGFVWSDSVFQTVDAPGAADTNITAINDSGVLVGNVFDSPAPLAGPFTAFVATPVPERSKLGYVAGLLAVLAVVKRWRLLTSSSSNSRLRPLRCRIT